MIIFLYGPDTYRSRRKLNEIIEHYKKIPKSGLNLKNFDFRENSFEDFWDAFRSYSMFDEKKLMIVRNVFSNIKIEKDFEKSLEKLSKSKEVVLFYEEEVDEKKPLFELLKKQGKSQNFKLLKGKALKNWVKREFKKYSANIDESALNLLLDFVGNNLWQMSNEIKKLVNYKRKPAFAKASAGKEKIETKDVRTLIRPKIETDIFKTIDAIAAQNKKRALLFIKKHLERGDSPSYILAMINFQFRNLLIIKDLIDRGKSLAAIFREANLHPYVIKKSYAVAKKFQFDELKKIHQKIFKADLGIKTGKISPQAALDLLITEI